MTSPRDLSGSEAEDLFEDAPCGYVSAGPDGVIERVNRTFEAMTGLSRADLAGARRFQDLLTAGGRIYHETHVAPLLQMQGFATEIAVEIVRADGSRLPALVNSVLHRDADGNPLAIRTTVFEATARRGYEQELLRRRRREHEIVQRLQRSMLSGDLPAGEAFELGVAYDAGGSELEVGGDWYDAFWLEEGRSIGLVVGDVVGRGLDASATMGQLRSVVRALASTGLGPAALLGALDDYARRHGVGGMTTLVYAELDLDERLLRHSSAGHLPPLLAQPGEEATMLWEGRSIPVDVFRLGADRADAELRLATGSLLVFYTDGLVERRDRSLDDGLEKLCHEVAERRDEPAGALTASLMRVLCERSHADDVCVLAVRLRS